MNEQEVLVELGLSESESKIYLSLLEIGPTLVGPVIRRTGLHRGTTYQILQRLREKGLVSSVIKGKKQYFSAAEPNRLLDVLNEKKEMLEQVLPSLISRLSKSKEQQKVTVYQGIKGIRSVLDKILEDLTPKGEYYDFGVSGLFREVMGPYWDLWQKKKKKNRIKSKVIFNESLKKENKKLLRYYHGEARFSPKEYSSITDTMIYKDSIALFIWTSKPLIAIVIKNKDNAESYKNQFRLLWKIAKK
jgi:sugar-specific transcriptional regulator TrmB